MPTENMQYMGREIAVAGSGFKRQTEMTPGTKERVVRVAEIRPIVSVVLSFTSQAPLTYYRFNSGNKVELFSNRAI